MRSEPVVDPHTLTGTWELHRTIDDRVAGATGAVAGVTEIEIEDTDRLRWSESGVMDWQGRKVPITRVLHLVRRPVPDHPTARAWFVLFDDGRDFHPWVTGERVEHPCGADLYRGRIDVEVVVEESGTQRWTVEWDVTGPAKDYTLHSVLRRRVVERSVDVPTAAPLPSTHGT